MHWEARMRRLAHHQTGVVGIHQMPAIGGDHRWWTRARRNGRWEQLSGNVLRADGWPSTTEQRAFAGVLDAGPSAFLFGESALAWVGLRNRRLEPVQVGRWRGTSNRHGALARAHRLRDVRPCDLVVVRGLTVLAPLRAVWVEAGRLSGLPLEWSVPRIERLLDGAHRAGLVTWGQLHASLTALGRRGRAGTTIMRLLAEDRPPGSSPTESRLEDRLETVLAEAQMAPLVRQVVVGGEHQIGRTDFRDEALPMVAEVNSLTFHTTPSDRDDDRRRYGQLLAAGFSVGVIWENDLWSDTAEVIRVVGAARDAARRGKTDIVQTASCPWPEDARDPLC